MPTIPRYYNNARKYRVAPTIPGYSKYLPILGWQHFCTSYWYFVLFISVTICLVIASLVMFGVCREGGGEENGSGTAMKDQNITGYEDIKDSNTKLENLKTNKNKNNNSACDIAFPGIIKTCFVIVLAVILISIIT